MGNHPIRIGVMGAGGLGKAAAKIISMKREAHLVAICDREGLAFDPEGLSGDAIYDLKPDQSVADISGGRRCTDSLSRMREAASEIDAFFVALPNLPNDFIPGVIRDFIAGGASGCFVDALKRTSAMEQVFSLHGEVERSRSVYLTGCGATPGLLSAAAVLAAQSFVKVEKVDIFWGVGIANWGAYRATIREDIAHLPGYTVEKARSMSDAEIDALLAQTAGRLEFHGMEHADDILLQKVGVVDDLEQVDVGGVMDTRSAKKPVSTTMTLTGVTFDGKRSSHRFILGDETTMASNVVGPALGYLKRALWLKDRGIFGIFGSTDLMPMVLR